MLNLSIDAILGFSPVPIRMILWLSICLWGISLIYLIRALIYHFFFSLTVTGWTSIIVLMFFFTGLILFSMAITGAYIGRIFQQGQNQPLYWLADVRNIELKQIGERANELREIRLSKRILKQQNVDDKGIN
jgi:dolichol-phosphate mannosyltransferase